MRTVEYYGQTFEIEDYQDDHRRANQINVMDGIPINPILRPGFDDTPNELRDIAETQDWWGKPYIVTETVDERCQSWPDHVALFGQYNLSLNEEQATYEQRTAKERQAFMASFPEGIKYTVRCLDGGAHDRSTWIGQFPSMTEAIEAAKDRADNLEYLQGVPPF